MAIYLVQHGKSLPKEKDPDQGLSDQGMADVKQIAEVAKGYNIQVDSIFHSVKKRARQTAEIFASELNPTKGIQEITGIKPMDDVAQFFKTLKNQDKLMVVGHLPFMQKLASYLIFNKTEPAVFKFQNGGIVCMGKDPDNSSWIIKWTLMPDIR